MTMPLCKIEPQNVTISEISSFHIGGETVELSDQPRLMMRVAGEGMAREVDLNGSYVTGQLYANHVKLAAPRHDDPVMFWHGGAMTGVTWETTPDGRPGWQWLFLQAGYDVIVTDAVERGRASWSPYPQIYDTGPVFRTKEEAWSMYRVGTRSEFDARIPFDGQRFPVSAFDALAAQLVPRWTTHDDMTLDAYQAALEKIGPVHLVAHSQGGWFALNMVKRVPHLVKSVVVIEPAGAPQLTAEDVARMGDIPHLFMWGDFINEVPSWKKYRSATDQYREVLTAAGKSSCEMDLPSMGIRGNSHVPMMDDNSADIAAMIVGWMAQNQVAEK
ncbi:alpha/beta fold hydrolase [Thalassospira sp.]|uniref:alpha/beta fold hydrolase n=1 Tax=Thalassospira sp. TaxID=1912094 RepID=UPI003AA7D4D8